MDPGFAEISGEKSIMVAFEVSSLWFTVISFHRLSRTGTKSYFRFFVGWKNETVKQNSGLERTNFFYVERNDDNFIMIQFYILLPLLKLYMKWTIYWPADMKSSKLWSSQLYGRNFCNCIHNWMQLQNCSLLWTQNSLCNCKNCIHNCKDHSLLDILLFLLLFNQINEISIWTVVGKS